MKNEKKSQTINLTNYNFLKAKDLWPAHYQILSIVFLKEFIELNVNTDVVIRTLFLNLQTLKII